MASTATAAPRGGTRVHVQRFGTFLSNMILPNIAAFIAWGFITALFIQAGWITLIGDKVFGFAPGLEASQYDYGFVSALGGWDADGGGIVGPMITYLLPLLIGYTGGRMTYNDSIRGGVVGAIATMGAITAANVPMFLGAMVMGPLGGYTMKRIDALWAHKIKPGFEMLVNNFSAGIWGMILALFGFAIAGPFVEAFSNVAENVVDFLVDHSLLPLTSIFVEPAKILFLNNAINHGVFTPLGTQEAVENGQSILFLIEANPGPGAGLLLAFIFFGKGLARATAPGALVIQFFGGIHEIYFPYVLMKPKLVLAVILGGMTGVATNLVFDSGLRAPAAPGSIIAVWLQAPASSLVGVTLSVLFAGAVSFTVASILLRLDRASDEDDLAAATAQMEANKGKKSSVAGALAGAGAGAAGTEIRSIVFACDAGMGSSAMGASVLRKKIQAAGHGEVTVVNKAISDLSDTYDVVVTHQDLTDRARAEDPVGDPRLRRQLHGQPALRRDRRPHLADLRRHGGTRGRVRGRHGDRHPSGELDRAGRHGQGPGRGDRGGGSACSSSPARSSRRTSPPCTSGRSRCPPTWATGSRSRTAPTRRRARSGVPRSRSCATTCPWTGRASRPSS